jgi:hypothetical protein
MPLKASGGIAMMLKPDATRSTGPQASIRWQCPSGEWTSSTNCAVRFAAAAQACTWSPTAR